MKLKIVHRDTSMNISGNIFHFNEIFEMNDHEGEKLLKNHPGEYEKVEEKPKKGAIE